ncbi:MAG: lipid-binding SYLF domain-containing protein, partial [Pseudomonadota bacterium]|nr:lipid-binding SYLF domain-containing protein [Pseudomonadota bacterium]
MFDRKRALTLMLLACFGSAPGYMAPAAADAREEGRLLVATEVLEEVEGMPDQRLPDTLLSRAYGIAVIPDVTKVAFIFGGRHGNGVLSVRDSLTSAWSNPVFISLTGGSWGFQAGAQSSDIILVFTTKAGIEGIAGGKLTLGADASVATGPVGRQGSAATDVGFNAEIYSYARTRGLFGGVALDGSVIAIDRSANASFYGKNGVTASEILSGLAPAAPATAQRFLQRLASDTRTVVRTSPAPQADVPAAPAGRPAAPAGADSPR